MLYAAATSLPGRRRLALDREPRRDGREGGAAGGSVRVNVKVSSGSTRVSFRIGFDVFEVSRLEGAHAGARV